MADGEDSGVICFSLVPFPSSPSLIWSIYEDEDDGKFLDFLGFGDEFLGLEMGRITNKYKKKEEW